MFVDRQKMLGVAIVLGALIVLVAFAYEANADHADRDFTVSEINRTSFEHYRPAYYTVADDDFENAHVLLYDPDRKWRVSPDGNFTLETFRDGAWLVFSHPYHDNHVEFVNMTYNGNHTYQYKNFHNLDHTTMNILLDVLADAHVLNQTVRQQAAHVSQLQSIIFDMGKDIGAMNNTINELRADMAEMKKEMQSIAPLN